MTDPLSEPLSRPRAPDEWSVPAMLSFGAILVMLTGVGALGMLHRPEPPRGLPDDPAVEAARAALGGPLEVEAGELRFATALDTGLLAPAAGGADPGRDERLAAAARRLHEAAERRPGDPRLSALLGHLELAAQRLERAERFYREALTRAPRYGEARLGLAVALARRAATVGESRLARRLRLQSIAQLAAVEKGDPLHPLALYDRALLLLEVGRVSEARRLAARYAELDPGSPWTLSLTRKIEGARPS